MANPPLDDRDGFIWIDGAMLPWRAAQIHFLTHGLHYGTAVFEGERAYNGKIFKSHAHTDRLLKSAEIIYLPVEFSAEQIEAAKREILTANTLTNAYIRVVAWRGSEQLGVDPSGARPRLGIAAWVWKKYFDPALAETGISLLSSRWRKPAPDAAPIHAKASSLYNLGSMVKLESIRAGYTDGLMLDFEGYVAESTGANLFGVKGEQIFTPIADRFLNGLTRQTVIGLARDLGYTVAECRIRPGELPGFEEIFVTGTAAEVTAVGKIDSHVYKVGPVTKRLQAAYTELTGAGS